MAQDSVHQALVVADHFQVDRLQAGHNRIEDLTTVQSTNQLPKLIAAVNSTMASSSAKCRRPRRITQNPTKLPGSASTFTEGRDFAAWIGLTSLQRSAGGKHYVSCRRTAGARRNNDRG
jgi:hypothetical protein